MVSSHQLHHQLYETLRAYLLSERVTRIRLWVWVVVGILQSRSVQLQAIALMIPSAAQAAGRIMQVRRWLANRHLAAGALYAPLIREVLRAWRGRQLTLILDGTTVNRGRLQLIQCSLSHCYRALPVAWQVVPHTGGVRVATAGALLREVAALVGHSRRVTLVADRGFRDCEWARLCRSLGWNYILRVANNSTVYFESGRRCPIRQ